MAKRKRLTDDDLRAEPEYQELGALLDKQSDTQKVRLEKTLAQEKQVDESCEPCDTESGEPCEPSQLVIPAKWLDALRDVIREEVKAVVANQTIPANLDRPVPPMTPKKTGTKQYQGQRGTLPGCRIDKNLMDAFEGERRRLAISASELMQRVLWTYFDQPPLSFQERPDND